MRGRGFAVTGRAPFRSALMVFGMLCGIPPAFGLPPEAADFDGALCTGLASQIAAASDQQHIDRRAIVLALHIKGEDDARQQALSRCLADALPRDGFTIDESGTARGLHDLLTITIGVPLALSEFDQRVDFAVSRCRPGSRFWAHPGHVDFHRRDGRWSNDAAVISRFVDGACSVRPPLRQ